MQKQTVREGYDRIAETYVAQRDQFKSQPYLERFAHLLAPASRVLDLGCGGGLPVDAWLIDRGHQVHGLDLSPRMIDLARANVPQATYELADMAHLRAGQYTVDGIVSLYAIFHTPREQHGVLLRTIASCLALGGALLITMGASEWEGVEEFHGTAMAWSHYDAATNAQLVEQAGFRIVVNEIDDSGDEQEQHQVIVAKLVRPDQPARTVP